MKLSTPVPAPINWAVISDWHQKTSRREGSHSINMFIQEAAPNLHDPRTHDFNFSWLLFYLWCGVRTNWFTSKSYYDNLDVANIGGKYLTYRAGTKEAALEFSKFDTLEQLPDTDGKDTGAMILQELKALMAHAMDVNPEGEKPAEPPTPIPAPLPPPVVVPLPQPVPAPPPATNPEEPAKPWWKKITLPAQWKTKFKWVGGLASVALTQGY